MHFLPHLCKTLADFGKGINYRGERKREGRETMVSRSVTPGGQHAHSRSVIIERIRHLLDC